jgi:hypothetical protein
MGDVAMSELVFALETIESLLPNEPGIVVQEKNHECGTGRGEFVECAKLGGLTHLYNILHSECNLLPQTLCAQRLGCQKNTIDMVFTLDFWKRSFFGHGESLPTHSEPWHFVLGS